MKKRFPLRITKKVVMASLMTTFHHFRTINRMMISAGIDGSSQLSTMTSTGKG